MKRKKEPDEFWRHWTDAWQDYVLQETGLKPTWTKDESAGLKKIRTYFLSTTNDRTGELNTEEDALLCFKYILSHRKSLPLFYQRLKPMFIFSNLLEIVSHLKKGSRTRQIVQETEKAKVMQFKREL